MFSLIGRLIGVIRDSLRGWGEEDLASGERKIRSNCFRVKLSNRELRAIRANLEYIDLGLGR